MYSRLSALCRLGLFSLSVFFPSSPLQPEKTATTHSKTCLLLPTPIFSLQQNLRPRFFIYIHPPQARPAGALLLRFLINTPTHLNTHTAQMLQHHQAALAHLSPLPLPSFAAHTCVYTRTHTHTHSMMIFLHVCARLRLLLDLYLICIARTSKSRHTHITYSTLHLHTGQFCMLTTHTHTHTLLTAAAAAAATVGGARRPLFLCAPQPERSRRSSEVVCDRNLSRPNQKNTFRQH